MLLPSAGGTDTRGRECSSPQDADPESHVDRHRAALWGTSRSVR